MLTKTSTVATAQCTLRAKCTFIDIGLFLVIMIRILGTLQKSFGCIGYTKSALYASSFYPLLLSSKDFNFFRN